MWKQGFGSADVLPVAIAELGEPNHSHLKSRLLQQGLPLNTVQKLQLAHHSSL